MYKETPNVKSIEHHYSQARETSNSFKSLRPSVFHLTYLQEYYLYICIVYWPVVDAIRLPDKEYYYNSLDEVH